MSTSPLPTGSGAASSHGVPSADAAPPLRVAAIRSYRLSARLPESLGWSQGRFDSRQTLLLQVIAENGAEGWGECAGPPVLVQAAVHEMFAPLLLGRDAHRTDAVWHALWQASQPWGRRGLLLAALSGIDIALWDLKGRALGLPVCELLGGRLRDRVPCYATGLYFRDRPETEIIPLLIQEAVEYVEYGYRAVKAHVGRNPSYDRALVRALRQALPNTLLIADACHGYDMPEALHMGRLLGDEGYFWFEDPISLERPAQLRQLADAVRLPIACGKYEQTASGFQSLLTPGGVTYAQPNVTYCGGLSEATRIRAVSAALGVTLAPHTGSNATMIGLAATLHFLASTFRHPGRMESTLGYLERNGSPNPLRDAIFCAPLAINDGFAEVPVTPGLGVCIDQGEMRQFCVSEQETAA